ncbi:MAG TPA: glycosyltransferase [Ktedonobacterales bacterium]
MILSVIVITYHRGAFLQQALESIYLQERIPGPYEVLVVDNGGDAVVGPSPRPDIEVRVVQPGRNLGVAGGRNLGMSLARGDYLIVLDDDAAWHDSLDMARFLELFTAEPCCACIAGKILNPATRAVDRHLLPAPDKDRLLHAEAPIPTPYFYGGVHALRAECVREIGGYPERLKFGMEEYDLSLRLVNAGYTILFHPAIAALHYDAQTGRDIVGGGRWVENAVNKTRVAWRLLPLPYPLTIALVWSAAVLVKTAQPGAVLRMWRTLWGERELLRDEREVISAGAVRYLKQVGARLLY